MTDICFVSSVALLAFLPFGPDTLIFIFSVAPTDKRTLIVSAWIGMLIITSAMTIASAMERRSAEKRVIAAGIVSSGTQHPEGTPSSDR
jgi:hypothetical protein